LSAFIEAKGAREAIAAVAGVEEQLKDAKKAAVEATAAVNRFGRVRGIAVLDVDAARARAQAAEATKAVENFGDKRAIATASVDATTAYRVIDEADRQLGQFSRETSTATLAADATRVHLVTTEATREVREFGRQKATAVLDTDTAKVAEMGAAIRGSTKDATGLAHGFEEVHKSKSKADKLIDSNVGTFGRLAQRIRGTGDATVSMRGSLGPLSGGLGVVATAALFFGTSLLSIAGPAVAVAAALAPLVGLAAGVAGGLVAAAQGFGVFKLATMGVLDALKEQNKLSQAAGTGASNQAGQEVAAARQIRSAQEGVRAAKEATARASQSLSEAQRTERQAAAALGPAYTEAKMRLRDMRDAVIATNLSLQDAQFAAADARKALSDLLGGPSPRQLADAHLAVADAMRGERNAAMDLADAQKALNDLMAPPDILDLADARDRVADATRGETKAQIALAKQLQDTNAILADPGASELDKADARARLADAENAVGDAARETARAQQALSKLEAPASQDEIARARGRVEDAEAGVAAAKRNTLDAQDALAKVESGASSDDLARARLALAEAEHSLSDAVKDSTRAARDYGLAEAAGLAKSPSVIAAREALRSASLGTADAERALADAQRQEAIAARSVQEAQADAARSAGVAAGAAANLNRKMDALPAPAQAFVRVLQSMKPKLDELRNTAAGGFFPGATDGLRAAMGSFSSVKKVVGETATVLGDAARKSGELVGSPAFGKDIETIGGRNAKVLGTLGEALRHVVSALRHVLVAAGPLTQWLADVANKWALNAAESAKAGRESGKLAAFFDKTRATAQRLGSILGHLAHGLFGVGKAGTDSGNDILASIDRAAKRFDAWANSVGGQKSIQEFFSKTKDIASAMVPAISNLAKGFGVLSLKLLPVTTALRLLGPYADEAVIAFVAWKLAITGVNIVAKLFAAQAAIAAFATGGWTTAFWALNAALAANPIGLIVLALAALVAAFVLAWKNSETFRDIVTGAWDAIKTAVGATIGWVTGAIKDAWDWITGATTDTFNAMVAFFTGLPGRIADAIKSGASSLLGAATWIKDQLVNGVQAYLGLYVAVGTWIVNRLVDGVKAVAGALADAAGWIKNRLVDGLHAISDAFVSAGSWVLGRIVDGIKVVSDALATLGGWLKNRVMDALTLAADGFVAAGSWVINRVVDGVRTVSDGLASVGGWLKNRVMDAIDAAKDGFLSIGSTIIGWIVDGLKSGANLLVDFVNDIIHVINKLPGVNIGDIKGFAEGGVHSTRAADTAGAATAFARGGAFGMTGGLVDQPIAIMGEEAPRFPEFVIPTNPAYRGRAQQLAMAAAGAVGVPGFALGGILDAVKGGAGDLWDLASSGVSGLVGHLPGIGDLPDWIKGLGSWVIDRIKDWLDDQIGGLFGGGDGGGKPNLGGVMKAATDLAKHHFPYLYGGGHGNFAIQPVDCSGGVSFALHGGNMLDSPMTTDGLKVYGEAGDGKAITIGVRGSTGRNAHTMMEIAGRFFESGSGHGWAQTSGWSGNFPIHRHPPGFATGGVMDSMLADIFDPTIVGWGLAEGGLLGSFRNGTDYVPQTGPYLLHKGESVTPASTPSPQDWEVNVYIGGEKIDERVDVRIERKDRASARSWNAGIHPGVK
jgi:hypothetical protein